MHQSIHHNDASMHYFLQANAENAAMHQQTRAIILKLMADQGIGSERQLAIDCGMSQSTLNRFMSGKTETLEFLHLHNIAQHLNVAGCASSPAVPPVQPVVLCPKMPAPAAWAMEPSHSTQLLQGVFSISGSPSSPTRPSSPISGSTPSPATGPGLRAPGE